MSYNVDRVDIQGRLYADPIAVEAWFDANWEELAEIASIGVQDNGDVLRIQWYGEGSGWGLEKFEEMLALVDGEGQVLLTWEGGDSFSGYVRTVDEPWRKGSVTWSVK